MRSMLRRNRPSVDGACRSSVDAITKTMGLNKSFYGLPLATLESLRAKYLACLEAIAVAGASYSIAGRSFTRANLAEVSQTVKELTAAIESANGTRVRRTVTAFPTQLP